MRTAVVVGAGVGGLAAAGALATSGWQVTLLEHGDRLRGTGGAQVIWPNGAAALDALGLHLGDISFAMPAGGIRRPDGRWIVESTPGTGDPLSPYLDATAAQPPPAVMPQPGTGGSGASESGAPRAPFVVHADDLHDALMAGLGDKIEIRTGVEITSVRVGEASWPAVSTARHTFQADLVVAADGARSLIRRRLAPAAQVASAGYTAWRAVIPWYRAPKLPDQVPAAGEMLGVGMRFSHATLGERGTSAGSTRGGIYWVATAPGALRPEPPAAQLTLLRRWFADWQSPVAELLEATEPEDLVPQSAELLRPLPSHFGFPIGGGGVVLVGDAAHVMAPTLTQGACLAFEDAATLGVLMRSAIPGGNINLRLAEYTEARRARVARMARTSRRLDLLFQAQGRLGVAARDAALSRFSSRVLDRANATAYDWTAPLATY
jgi:2-polyprenyl-6-methoxyphenol hydroxylase-like FAD-dependent oxidoreductase